MIIMKKILQIVVISLFLCNFTYADTVEELLNNKYKITKEELVKFDRYAQKIFTLKKGKQVKICTIEIHKIYGVSSNTKCVTP